jgi:hypothetical protein
MCWLISFVLLLLLSCSVLLVQNIEDVDEILRAVKRYRWAAAQHSSTHHVAGA